MFLLAPCRMVLSAVMKNAAIEAVPNDHHFDKIETFMNQESEI